MNQVLGISMKQICLSLSDVAASLRRAPLFDALGWKPLSSMSPLTTSRWVSSRGKFIELFINRFMRYGWIDPPCVQLHSLIHLFDGFLFQPCNLLYHQAKFFFKLRSLNLLKLSVFLDKSIFISIKVVQIYKIVNLFQKRCKAP